MARKKYKTNNIKNEANEPVSIYAEKSIQIFNSFEEQEDFQRKQMATLGPEELLNNLEKMRKFFLKQYLLPDGSWPPLAKIITIHKPKGSY